MPNHQPDEADRHKARQLPHDAKADAQRVSAKVPRVLTVREIMRRSADRALSLDEVQAFTTGHWKLDKITGGLRPGFVWLLGADTSWGKSSWLVALADENIRLGKRVLIVSSEDTEEVYGDRLVVRRSGVSAERYRDRELEPAEMTDVENVVKRGEDVPVYLDARRMPIEEAAAHVVTIVREQRIDVVAYDYLQEFSTKRRFQDERVKFKEIASVMRHTIKSAKVTGIIFSQLTISSETKIPNRHNIRECRDVANASEVILIGFEPDVDVKDKNKNTIVEAGTKCVYVDKVKNGPRGAKVAMQWNERSASFNRVLRPANEEPPPEYEDLGADLDGGIPDWEPPPYDASEHDRRYP